ncbi:MAG: radical SAM protein [Spirochaetaceae bacterium]|jgi:uncharacterized protein|nr:radical SAM protein [Spirochaetaceae bacterium]
MEFSKYTIFSKIHDSSNYFLANPLTGEADILEPEIGKNIEQGIYDNPEELQEKGYLVDPEAEKKLYMRKYLDFIEDRDSDEIQIFFVPSYQCNFNCSYCYQSGYDPTKQDLSPQVVEAFFSYIDSKFAGREKYITLFGGEPLLPNQITRDNISLLLKGAKQRNLSVAVVTNGHSLKSYIPQLKQAMIREIQVTLDGVAEAHDKRRPLQGGQGSFDAIVEGIDEALAANLPVNLRMVVDKENIHEIPKLAQFAIDRGWTKHPLFKTQLGRNYELHYCQANQKRLYNRIDMYQDLYRLLEQHPHILEFHRPAFSLSRFLWENGDLPDSLLDSCPGTKTEWAFDYTGRIYSCTATVGKEEEQLGSFYPQVRLKEDLIEQWQDRDVTTIDKCKNCTVQLACGGGCASVAKNNHGGRLNSPDCRPVKELMELGLSAYFEKEWLETPQENQGTSCCG